MFPTEEEKARETPADRERRLARTGMGRRGLNQVVTTALLFFCGMALLVAADVAGVERRLTKATVMGFADRWSTGRTHECVTQLLTGYGDAKVYTRNACRDAPWHVGDTAEVEARRLRFTGTIVVTTKGTIFKDAHSILSEW